MKAKIKSITQLDFFRNVVHTVVSKVLFIGIGVATSIIIMRTLGPELRGVYAKALAISSFAVQFGTLGFHASNTYFTAKNRSQMGSIAANSAYISALIGAISLLSLWGSKVLFPNIIQFSFLEIFLIVLTIPTQLLGMLWKAVAQGMEWFKLINVTEVALRLVYFVVMMG
ncbi:MAG: lipopolysaccharide biosynthesis protein, partial [Bacteroidia bacterium]